MIGVYILRHPATKVWYIGSSMCIHDRLLQHFAKLAQGKHENATLQLVFKESKYFDIEKLPQESIEVAKALEKKMIQDNQTDENLANCVNVEAWHKAWKERIMQYWTPERRKAHGELQASLWNDERRAEYKKNRTGFKHTEETRIKMSRSRKGKPISAATAAASAASLRKKVMVEGVEYDSMKAVTIAYGVTKEAVLRRIRSSDPKWKNWYRPEETPCIQK